MLVANGVEVAVDSEDGYTPTPAISHAILTHNARGGAQADGIVITPSHNPPEDGGFKYNPPHGGPADTDVTREIQDAANELLRAGLRGVERLPLEQAIKRARRHDFRAAYVERPGRGDRPRGDRGRRDPARGRSAGRCERCLLGDGR